MADLIKNLAVQSNQVSEMMGQFGSGAIDFQEPNKVEVKQSALWKRIQVNRNANSTQTRNDVTGRYRNKFEEGWLGGVGGDSQFQGVNQQVGLQASKATNNSIVNRFTSTLQPSWARSYAFNVGFGTDALDSKITWTSKSGGIAPVTGGIAPILHSSLDRVGQEPIPGRKTFGGGAQNVVGTAPLNLHGGEGAGDPLTLTTRKKINYKPVAPVKHSAKQSAILKQQRKSKELYV